MWGAETDGPAEGLLSNRKSQLTDPTCLPRHATRQPRVTSNKCHG